MLIFSCQKKLTNVGSAKFRLTGKTNNIADGTMIYFVDVLSNKIFDSTSISNNYLKIEHSFPVYPTLIFLHSKDYSESKQIWVEDNHMIFDASKSDFSEAIISGSKTHDEFELFLKQTDTIESNERSEIVVMDFIRNHPDSRFGVSMLAGYAPNWGSEKVKTLYNGLSKENKASVYGIRIAKFIELNRPHEIGDKFTDFEMENEKGETISLSDKLGKITLLDFWASWCGPCRAQNPDLVKTYKKYNSSGFEIFSVSLDFSKENWVKAIEKDRMTWNHVSDLKGRNSAAGMIYSVNAIPDNILLDKNGIIIAKYLWGEELNKAIESELKKE